MRFYRKKDTTSIMSSEINRDETRMIKEEISKIELKNERDNLINYYEKELNHYKRQKQIFLNNLNNAKTDSEKYRFTRLLEYNKKNYDKTLLLIKQRDNIK